MKLKRIITIICCALVSIATAILIAFYTYGSIGDWTKPQESFVEEHYDNLKTSKSLVEEYIKFNSVKYRNHTVDVKLYEDYLTSTNLLDCGEKVTLDNLSFSLYTLMGDNVSKKFDYSVFFYEIDNSAVSMKAITVVLFESIDDANNAYLKQSIQSYKDTFLDPDKVLEPIYAEENLNILSKNNFFTNGNPLYDLDGSARIVGGVNQPRYLYDNSLTYSFGSTQIKNITTMDHCDFAIFELLYEYNDEGEKLPSSINTLCVGQINNISSTQDEYVAKNTVLDGYGLETLPALVSAGYKDYVMPKCIKNAIFAFVIMGVITSMFYLTLNNYWKKNEAANKNKKNSKRE